MPEIELLEECKFNCDPDKPENWCDDCKAKYTPENKKVFSKPTEIVTVPLSVTEDSLLGSIDIELLLKEGKLRFIPGILAKAHRQILYIDEVNLLPDHIIDDILDVSATRWNHIEKENFSIAHPSEFLLIGTMNPEEGELRPQILDRFPLSVEVKSVKNDALRKEIIKRNIAFETNPQKFIEQFKEENEKLKNQIRISRKILDSVKIKPIYYDVVVRLCSIHNVDGHRADISIIKTAKTYAAFEMKNQVELRHLRQAAKFVLNHRTREGGFSKPLEKSEIDTFFDNLNLEEIEKNPETDTENINKDIHLFSQGNLIQQEKK